MKLINLTPHPINVIVDGQVVNQYPSMGVLRASSCSRIIGEVDGIQLSKVTYGEVTGLPEPKQGVMYIVSRAIKKSVPDRDDCIVPNLLVRDKNGNITGCRGFSL